MSSSLSLAPSYLSIPNRFLYMFMVTFLFSWQNDWYCALLRKSSLWCTHFRLWTPMYVVMTIAVFSPNPIWWISAGLLFLSELNITFILCTCWAYLQIDVLLLSVACCSLEKPASEHTLTHLSTLGRLLRETPRGMYNFTNGKLVFIKRKFLLPQAPIILSETVY